MNVIRKTFDKLDGINRYNNWFNLLSLIYKRNNSYNKAKLKESYPNNINKFMEFKKEFLNVKNLNNFIINDIYPFNNIYLDPIMDNIAINIINEVNNFNNGNIEIILNYNYEGNLKLNTMYDGNRVKSIDNTDKKSCKEDLALNSMMKDIKNNI